MVFIKEIMLLLGQCGIITSILLSIRSTENTWTLINLNYEY